MKRLSIIILLSLNVLFASAQYYLFDSIPQKLRKGADAVVRSAQCLYRMDKPGHAVMKVRKAVTLLNEDADIYRYLTVNYDKFSRVNYVRGTIYDEKGVIIKVLGPSDVFDMSAVSGGDVYSSDRIKWMYFPLYRYPYTIEYEYEITITSSMRYSWPFQEMPDISVQKSGIQFVIPGDMTLRFFDRNLRNQVDSVILNNEKIYTWQEENIAAYNAQDLPIRRIYKTPYVVVAPMEFEYGGITGSNRSWKDFGLWFYQVAKDRDELPEADKLAAKELVKDISDPLEKVRKIYEFMQSSTRYVSIQIGIGGNQPAKASDVSKYGYGDCKALVNYTRSLLKAVGIDSYYTLANAGTYEDITANFVFDQFNHVILCVPINKDSIWLECTSKTLPANFLGSSTAGKHVLIITPEGGKLVKTPLTSRNYSKVRTGSLSMNVLGAVTGRLNEEFKGAGFEQTAASYSFESQEEIMRSLRNGLRFADFNIKSADYKEEKYPDATSYLKYDLDIRNFGSINGQRIYFSPGIALTDYLRKAPDDVEVYYSSTVRDSISYTLPLNFGIEYLPEKVEVRSEFGTFSYSLSPVKDKIIFIRTLSLNRMKIPAEKYDEFRSFVNTIAETDTKKIILSRIAGS